MCIRDRPPRHRKVLGLDRIAHRQNLIGRKLRRRLRNLPLLLTKVLREKAIPRLSIRNEKASASSTFAGRCKPVSYTHLDVYKRQVTLEVNSGWLVRTRAFSRKSCSPVNPITTLANALGTLGSVTFAKWLSPFRVRV